MRAERGNRRIVVATLASAGALGAVLRLAAINWGVPDPLHPDETWILNRILTFAKGDPNPHNFLYPTLYFYASFLWQGGLLILGRVLGWYHSASDFERAYFVDPTRHIVAARVLTALFGVATIPAVYRLGRRLFDAETGALAALFLAIAPLAVRDAHYVKLDVPAALFVTLALATLAGIATSSDLAVRRGQWLVGGLFVGLAASTQYYAVVAAAPFVVVALIEAARRGEWRGPAMLLVLAGLASVAGFVATSPYFVLDLRDVARDFAELHKVDIGRAVSAGAFSSLSAYGRFLARDAMGWQLFLLALAGALLACARDWRRGIVLLAFPVAFLAFLANTFPASRYINAMTPSLCVAAAYAARVALSYPRARTPIAMLIGVVIIAAAADCVAWDRFFLQADTRTEARVFIEQHVPAGATMLVQPHSVPIRQSREALLEALRANLSDPARASIKFRFELDAAPPGVGYRPLYLGDVTQAERVLNPDTMYVSTASLGASPDAGLTSSPLRALGVTYVVLERYNGTEGFQALRRLADELDRSSMAQRVAEFSPYGADVSADERARIAPFFHNTADRMSPALERPGPIIDIWRIQWN